jgi:hypothetical protein
MAEGERQTPVRRAVGQGPSPSRLDSTDVCYQQVRDFLSLDLTDATLDLTDKRAVIPWTLPTNLIAKSNILPNSPVGRVQPSIVKDSQTRMQIWGKFTH